MSEYEKYTLYNDNLLYKKYKIIDDIFINIISFFHPDQVFPFVETCKSFYNIINYIKKLPKNTFPKYLKFTINPQTYYLVSSIEMIEWAKTHNTFKYSKKATILCARKGNLTVLKYLLKDGCYFDNQVYYEAALNGSFDIIKWCYKNNYGDISNNLCMHGACQYGDLKIVKWLYDRNFPINRHCGHHASYFGHLDVLKFLVEKGYIIDNLCFNSAAENGQLNILKYLDDLARHDLSLPWWNETTIVSAAENNQLKIIKYLRKNNCKWDCYATYSAYDNNHTELLFWLIKNKCPIDSKLYNTLKKEYKMN